MESVRSRKQTQEWKCCQAFDSLTKAQKPCEGAGGEAFQPLRRFEDMALSLCLFPPHLHPSGLGVSVAAQRVLSLDFLDIPYRSTPFFFMATSCFRHSGRDYTIPTNKLAHYEKAQPVTGPPKRGLVRSLVQAQQVKCLPCQPLRPRR